MKARITDGFLWLMPENEEERKDACEWYEGVEEHYDDLKDLNVWVQEVGFDEDLYDYYGDKETLMKKISSTKNCNIFYLFPKQC